MHALLAFSTVLLCLAFLCTAYGVVRIVLTLREMSARAASVLHGVRR